jgi:hypothetical protein
MHVTSPMEFVGQSCQGCLLSFGLIILGITYAIYHFIF